MNITKTKVMVVDNTAINVYNVLIENDELYVYLEQHWSLRENNQDKEIKRGITPKYRYLFKGNLAIS